MTLAEKSLFPSHSASDFRPHVAFECSIFVEHIVPDERLPKRFYHVEDPVPFPDAVDRDTHHVSPGACDKKLPDYTGCSQLAQQGRSTDA